MNRGGTFIAAAATLAVSACLGDQGKLEIRSVDRGISEGVRPVPLRVAEAYGQLAVGNVALALEGFRKAERDDPQSIDALAGLARCYDQMQRFDLSRRYYEQALAQSPHNQTLLAMFAASLDLQGEQAEAASVRREMAALPAALPDEQAAVAELAAQASLAAAAPAPPPPEIAAPAQALQVAPVGQSVTIALPPPRPAPAAKKEIAAAPLDRQPRLERLSLTEVALVTTGAPRWRPLETMPVRTAARMAPAKPLELRVLNAARVDKLAARTRNYLGRLGWRSIAVGDAAAVRTRSLIVYPQGAQAAASRLAARLGFATAPRNDVRQLTILLGRDAATHPALRPKA